MFYKLKFLVTLFVSSMILTNVYAFDEKSKCYFISEVKTGVVGHYVGFFGRQTEEGLDSTFEFLFRKINYNLFWLGTPRPHLGATINMNGDTSQAYGGVTWDYKLPKRMFL